MTHADGQMPYQLAGRTPPEVWGGELAGAHNNSNPPDSQLPHSYAHAWNS
jgi:hypothetical protein